MGEVVTPEEGVVEEDTLVVEVEATEGVEENMEVVGEEGATEEVVVEEEEGVMVEGVVVEVMVAEVAVMVVVEVVEVIAEEVVEATGVGVEVATEEGDMEEVVSLRIPARN